MLSHHGFNGPQGVPGPGPLPSGPRPASDPIGRAVGSVMGMGRNYGRVLLVENDRDIAEMYRYKLDLDGYEVLVAASGAEALAAITAWKPALVLLDIGLPDMTGLEILEVLGDDPRDDAPPALVLSADHQPDLVERALDLGALDWLRKDETPPSTLSRWVRAWLFAVSAVPAGEEMATP